jgi:uncharacterized protein (TIGR02246 family)
VLLFFKGVTVVSNRPDLVSRELVRLLEKGDIDAVLGLYEPDAVFADFDGAARGLDEIREAHQRFLDAGLTLTLRDSVVFEAADLALVHWSWTVVDRDGSTTEGASAEVLRRRADGTWKFIIDNSDGSALVGHL